MALVTVLNQQVTNCVLGDFLRSKWRRCSRCVHLDAIPATFPNPNVIPVPRTATAAPVHHSKKDVP
ncbi:hypothetical protein FD514_05470 [Cutibacterium acnes]|nr:hypothetical protein Asn12ST33_06905 [Cutibacterium acnes]REB12728.1 hypothetical protein COH13_05495 [Cutibacterium acnes]REB17175.1 hypothetical protein COH12_05500 [Cutibacterium acnes]TLG11628.1 hypothetical protein FD522_08570 [Cutibacterium acnes]TLG18425.1 hypothetical protein FD521_01070 [Cutibacterium acnes]